LKASRVMQLEKIAEKINVWECVNTAFYRGILHSHYNTENV
jgi:hypothetical protein